MAQRLETIYGEMYAMRLRGFFALLILPWHKRRLGFRPNVVKERYPLSAY